MVYDPNKKHQGFPRRESRIMDFTEDSLSALPKADSNCDHWYDRTQSNLMAVRVADGGPITFRYRLATHERRALGLGTTPYKTLGRMSLTEARAQASEVEAEIAEALKTYVPDPRKRRGKSKLKDDTGPNLDTVVEALMAERPAEENAHYETLMSVLMDAYAQATNGKGSERHAGGDVSFDKQDMVRIIEATSIDFAIGQAIKKMVECRRLGNAGAQRAELLGAIVYVAGAVVWLDKGE